MSIHKWLQLLTCSASVQRLSLNSLASWKQKGRKLQAASLLHRLVQLYLCSGERERYQEDLESVSGASSDLHWSWLQMLHSLHRCFTGECAAAWWCKVTDVGVVLGECCCQVWASAIWDACDIPADFIFTVTSDPMAPRSLNWNCLFLLSD